MIAPKDHFAVIESGLIGTLFSKHAVPACAINAERRISWVNRSFARLFGYQVNEMVGLPSLVLKADDFPAEVAEAIRKRVFHDRLPWLGAYRCLTKQREAFLTECFITPLDHFEQVETCGAFSLCWPTGHEDTGLQVVMAHMIKECFSLKWQKKDKLPFGKSSETRGRRRQEIQQLVRLGYSTKEIATIMKISPSTVNVVRWKLKQEAKAARTNPARDKRG